MSVWLTIPSKRPPEQVEPVLKLWRERGYKLALWRDEGDAAVEADWTMHGWEYPGYARAVNVLILQASEQDPSAEWFVIGGDDVEPDPNQSAEEIAGQCVEHFSRTWGVMQPTGDRFAGGQIDRICGSAWIGREFARRINQGRGPLWPEYTHMFADEELQCVAQKYGVFWQRPDLIHLHMHFARKGNRDLNAPAVDHSERPAFLDEANTAIHWNKSRTIFLTRKNAGFPGSEPL